MNNKSIILLLSASIVLVGIYFEGRRNSSALPKQNLAHLNLSKSDEQMIKFLQNYLQIDTTHPTPNYQDACAFLKKHAEQDGFVYQEVPLPSGRTAAIITLRGTDSHLPALALNHHMDVVPVPNEHDWVVPPFKGAIHGDQLIGRGAQDMKGIGAIHYFALKQLKQKSIQPKRTIHIFAVPDEEIGGFTGTKEFVESDAFKQLNVGYLLDEGHSSGDANALDFKVAERKPLQVTITSKGDLAHGSKLKCTNAIHELIEFLKEIATIHKESQTKAQSIEPGRLLATNITSLTAGARKANGHIALNVVPNCAQATIDIRVPSTMKVADAQKMLEEKLKAFPTLSYKVEAQAQEEPKLGDYQTELYQQLEKSINKFGINAKPHFFEGASDLRFYLIRGIQGIGFTPFTIEDNIHGTNEAVPLRELIRGKQIIEQFLLDFCCS
jgi:aminoacylase